MGNNSASSRDAQENEWPVSREDSQAKRNIKIQEVGRKVRKGKGGKKRKNLKTAASYDKRSPKRKETPKKAYRRADRGWRSRKTPYLTQRAAVDDSLWIWPIRTWYPMLNNPRQVWAATRLATTLSSNISIFPFHCLFLSKCFKNLIYSLWVDIHRQREKCEDNNWSIDRSSK